MALKYPALLLIAWINSSVDFLGYIQKGTTSTSPKTLKIRDFPSMTGRPATGPILPKPKIAVPSVTIAETFLDFEYGSSYFTIFLKVFSEKYGFSLYKSLKFSSIMIFPTN